MSPMREGPGANWPVMNVPHGCRLTPLALDRAVVRLQVDPALISAGSVVNGITRPATDLLRRLLGSLAARGPGHALVARPEKDGG